MSITVLMIDPFPAEMVQEIEGMGVKVVYEPELSRAEVLALLPEAEVVVMNSRINMDAEAVAAAPKLKLLCRAGVGVDHFDMPALEAAGIVVVNAPGANAVPVAEQAIGMLLSLMHNVARANRGVRQFQWQREVNRGTELMGKTVGIIGHGNTGSAVSARLASFGCKVLAYDKYKAGFGSDKVQESELQQIWNEADVLTLHIPLTEETRNWVNADFLARFRKPIYLLNLSRGGIVVEDDLLTALDSGKVIAAGFDVLENEKMNQLTPAQQERYEDFFSRENVIVTPHIGGWSHESLERINGVMVEAIRGYIGKV